MAVVSDGVPVVCLCDHRAGASHINVAAHGGQYGVWFAESEPGPVLTGGVFSNQTVSAVAFIAGRHAQGPLIVVGVTATQGPAPASGPLFSNVGYAGSRSIYLACALCFAR